MGVGYSGQPQHQLALTSTYCYILITILIYFCMSITFKTVSRLHQNPGSDP